MTCDEGRPCQRWSEQMFPRSSLTHEPCSSSSIKREIAHLCHDEQKPSVAAKEKASSATDSTTTSTPTPTPESDPQAQLKPVLSASEQPINAYACECLCLVACEARIHHTTQQLPSHMRRRPFVPLSWHGSPWGCLRELSSIHPKLHSGASSPCYPIFWSLSMNVHSSTPHQPRSLRLSCLARLSLSLPRLNLQNPPLPPIWIDTPTKM